MMKDDDGHRYLSPRGFVYIGNFALEIPSILDGVDHAERSGISLDNIGHALSHNQPATIVALAFHNLATLRAIIDDAERPRP